MTFKNIPFLAMIEFNLARGGLRLHTLNHYHIFYYTRTTINKNSFLFKNNKKKY